MLIELSKDEINCIVKALGTVIDEYEGCQDLENEYKLSDKLSKTIEITNKCDSCINLYKINNIRCCKLKPLIKLFDGMTSLRYLDSRINKCNDYEKFKK